jgi:hypothetical protein
MPGSSTEDAPEGEVGLASTPGRGRTRPSASSVTYARPGARGRRPRTCAARAKPGRGADRPACRATRPGLTGLSVGQAIQVLYWVDRGQRDLIVQSPATPTDRAASSRCARPCVPTPLRWGPLSSPPSTATPSASTQPMRGTGHRCSTSSRGFPPSMSRPAGVRRPERLYPLPWPRHPTTPTTR